MVAAGRAMPHPPNSGASATNPQRIERSADAPTTSHGDAEPMSLRKVEQKVEDLEHVAEVGESNKTPVILFADVLLGSLAAFLILFTIAMLAYRLA
jgi:hypothetical protein